MNWNNIILRIIPELQFYNLKMIINVEISFLYKYLCILTNNRFKRAGSSTSNETYISMHHE